MSFPFLLRSSCLTPHSMPCSLPDCAAVEAWPRWQAGLVQTRSSVVRTDKCLIAQRCTRQQQENLVQVGFANGNIFDLSLLRKNSDNLRHDIVGTLHSNLKVGSLLHHVIDTR